MVTLTPRAYSLLNEPLEKKKQKNHRLAWKDDESCFMWMRHRYYDSRMRGFLSRDPIEEFPLRDVLQEYYLADPLATGALGNLYAYVENNPGSFMDPWGLDKNSCHRFVMSLALTASGGKDLSFMRKSRVGGRIVDRHVGRQHGSATRWLGTTFGRKRSYSPIKGYSGFKSRYTRGGQNAAVMRHVASAASMTLRGFGAGIKYRNRSELRSRSGIQSWAEIAGNNAGRNIGRYISAYLDGKISMQELIKRMRRKLCE